MITDTKPQIDPTRDAELRRLAKRIKNALLDDEENEGQFSWSIIFAHLRRAEIARLRKGRT